MRIRRSFWATMPLSLNLLLTSLVGLAVYPLELGPKVRFSIVLGAFLLFSALRCVPISFGSEGIRIAGLFFSWARFREVRADMFESRSRTHGTHRTSSLVLRWTRFFTTDFRSIEASLGSAEMAAAAFRAYERGERADIPSQLEDGSTRDGYREAGVDSIPRERLAACLRDAKAPLKVRVRAAEILSARDSEDPALADVEAETILPELKRVLTRAR